MDKKELKCINGTIEHKLALIYLIKLTVTEKECEAMKNSIKKIFLLIIFLSLCFCRTKHNSA